MLDAIALTSINIGFIAAGGLKTIEEADAHLNLAEKRLGKKWVESTHFRFGASSLLQDALINVDNVNSSLPTGVSDY